jgi:hypothetical protein
MEVKPITVFVHDEIYELILSYVPESKLDEFYNKALWNVLSKKPFYEVITDSFDYSRGVPVSFTPCIPTYQRWCRIPKPLITCVMGAFNLEVYELLIDYGNGYHGGK